MKHHTYNPDFPFVVPPVEFNKHTQKGTLQYCLGATLYMPGTKNVRDKILNKRFQGLTSLVMCFEDAISEEDVTAAEENVLHHLESISEALHKGQLRLDDIPLIFLRVRNPGQFERFAARLPAAYAEVLSGFVFPKYDAQNGPAYLENLETVCERSGAVLYGMPILEVQTIALRETRREELSHIKILLAKYRDRILNIRVGATDFSSVFGVRRGINYSIYDIMVVRDCLSDILNFFLRRDEDYVISAPVWEYFLADKTESIEHLLEKGIHQSLLERSPIINEAIDGLLREVVLDKANGFVGKTIIHPSHSRYVNALQSVTREEYEDALQILATNGGVIKSRRTNKMNEINPHRNWARKTVNRAKAYGVIEDESAYLKLCMG